MSEIDQKRRTAVRALEDMGCIFRDGDWLMPRGWEHRNEVESDRLHGPDAQ